jgi:dihydroxyacetone kinase-like protein
VVQRWSIRPELLLGLIQNACQTVNAHVAELTELDAAIGDGDHGHNMKRGFDALGEAAPRISQLPLQDALREAGTTLLFNLGGAAGPLYGSLLLGMAEAAEQGVVPMLTHGVQAVMRRGRSTAGEKTMLDVLVPVVQALEAKRTDPIEAVRQAADRGLLSTFPMLATKGRASYLGARSIGHLDPGARSSALLVHSVCDVLESSS